MHCRGLKETAVKYNTYMINGKLLRTFAHDVGGGLRTTAYVCQLLMAKRTTES